jgi:predicted nucleic acid-binding protein
MQQPVCTIDASSVIALDRLNLLPQLSFLFSQVLLPGAVRTELFRRKATKDRLKTILDSYAFVAPCDDYDKGAVDILLIERATQGVKDRGEAEAVVQAVEVGAMVVVDDRWGRKLARRFGRDFHGTFWVLRRFFDLGLISSGACRAHFVELFHYGIRLPKTLVNEFLVDIGEPPIPHIHGV